ncbi:MAG: PilZ domain-containing protein [Sphingomonadales bacterium]|nr:PilZ domain-containing protein [Sphingomonadales bacterium]
MAQVVQNEDYDLRRAARHRADYQVIVESKRHGDQKAHIVNVSAHGFMTDDNEVFERGDRIELRLPEVGRIEAHLIWSVEKRAGFQFERVIRITDFMKMLKSISPKRR